MFCFAPAISSDRRYESSSFEQIIKGAMPKILLIDDDETVCEALSLMLEREGFVPLLAHDGESGFEKALTLKPQLVLVDLRLPGMSGVELCKQLRAANVGIPIIVLSGLDEELDKVLLLEIGADDYVVKPFSPRELLARIRAVLRRASAFERVIRFGEVEVDLDRRHITRRGQEINLTRQEYNLLTYFLNNADRALSRDAILNAVWGFESYPNTRTVDAHVVRLRQKLEPNPATPRHVLTIHGLGYRFSI
jgi:DNA-binding response OmpR family regulator